MMCWPLSRASKVALAASIERAEARSRFSPFYVTPSVSELC